MLHTWCPTSRQSQKIYVGKEDEFCIFRGDNTQDAQREYTFEDSVPFTAHRLLQHIGDKIASAYRTEAAHSSSIYATAVLHIGAAYAIMQEQVGICSGTSMADTHTGERVAPDRG